VASFIGQVRDVSMNARALSGMTRIIGKIIQERKADGR